MWNFGVPYRLKHYIDVVTLAGENWSWSRAEGYKSLVLRKKALLVYASAGDYGVSDPSDFQKPYLRRWLNFIGVTDIQEINVASLAMGGFFGTALSRHEPTKATCLWHSRQDFVEAIIQATLTLAHPPYQRRPRSVALTSKWLAEYRGTAMIEKHYKRYVRSDAAEQLLR